MASESLLSIKASVCKANLDLVKHGLVKYSFGNVSGIDRVQGVVAIKPSGIPYEELTPEKIVLLDLNGSVLEGNLRPSSDTATHLALYRSFPEIGGVAHTHSTNATAWAQAGLDIPCFGTTHADFTPHSIPCSRTLSDEAILGAYEHETGVNIVEVFSQIPYQEVPMVLVHGHGPFTWGSSADDAVYHSVMLEEIATMALATLQLFPDKECLKQILIHKHFYRKHGKNAYYGQV